MLYVAAAGICLSTYIFWLVYLTQHIHFIPASESHHFSRSSLAKHTKQVVNVNEQREWHVCNVFSESCFVYHLKVFVVHKLPGVPAGFSKMAFVLYVQIM